MSTTLAEISELTASLPTEEREVVEAKLVEATRDIVAAYQSESARRDDVTRRSLEDIAAGRFQSLSEFKGEMDTFLRELGPSPQQA